MTHRLLLSRLHLAESQSLARRNKNRIIAETTTSARRKRQTPARLALPELAAPGGVGKTQHAQKMRRRALGLGARVGERASDTQTRRAEIPRARALVNRPARRVNAGRAVQRVNTETRVVRERDAARRPRRRRRLQLGVAAESVGVLGDLFKSERLRRRHRQSERAEIRLKLANLARVMSRQQKRAGHESRRARTSRCAAKISAAADQPSVRISSTRPREKFWPSAPN